MKKILFLALFLFSVPFFSQEKADFATTIIGNWSGEGVLFGIDARFSMQWEKVHNDTFIQLSFKNEYKDKTGVTRVMTATGYYNFKKEKGFWVDSRGVLLPLVLKTEKNLLEVHWGDAQTEQGKTIYTIVGKNKIEVEDYFLKDNKYNLFGKATYRRNANE